jgi:hypothetical protein
VEAFFILFLLNILPNMLYFISDKVRIKMKNINERKDIVLSELNKVIEFAETNNVFYYKKQLNIINKFKLCFSKKLKDIEKLNNDTDQLHKEFVGYYISFLGDFFIGNKEGYLSSKSYTSKMNEIYIKYKSDCKNLKISHYKINIDVEQLIHSIISSPLKENQRVELPFEEEKEDEFKNFLLFLAGKQLGCNNRPFYLLEDIAGKKYCLESFKIILISNTNLANFLLDNSMSDIKLKYKDFFTKQEIIRKNSFKNIAIKDFKEPPLTNAYWNFNHIEYTISRGGNTLDDYPK